MPHADRSGYYAILGVSETATFEQIKVAFRTRAKKLHPDTNRGPSAHQEFQHLNEAYRVLSDPKRRGEYDASHYGTTDREPTSRIEPTKCSSCGGVTAQPRYVTTWRAFSLLLVSTKNPTQGILCAGCYHKRALKDTVLSALFGWWGFPWGPVFTCSSIWNNAFCHHNETIERDLLWWNALAFAEAGNGRLSYALTRKVLDKTPKGAALDKVGEMASSLAAYLEQIGAAKGFTELKDPWKRRPVHVLVHAAAFLPIPAFLFLLASDPKNASQSSIRPYAYFGSTYAPAPTNTTYALPNNNPTTRAASLCFPSPVSGAILSGRLSPNVRAHAIEIRNGSGGPAIIKIRDAYSGTLVESFFVNTNEVGSVSNLPDGSYRVQYAFGDALGADCRSFTTYTGIGEFPNIETFRTSYTEDQIVHQRLSYTLYAVQGGNVHPQTITASDFARD